MTTKYAKMTNEDFDRLLVELMEQCSVGSLIQIPGVYGVVSEHFTNEVLEAWEAEQDEDENENDESDQT